MSIPDGFEQKLAERAETERAKKRAEKEKEEQTERERQERLAKIAEQEETWFPKAKKWRDDDFDELLDQARSQLKAGGIKHRDRDRAYWSHLVSDSFEIALGIIPVPARGVIMLRATASATLDRTPHQIHDATEEYPLGDFDQKAMEWLSDQVVEMTAITISHVG